MIDIDLEQALRQPGSPFPFHWSGDAEFSELDLMEPLKIEGTLRAADDSVRVTGQVEAKLRLPCSRCLETVVWDAGTSFDELFLTDPTAEEDAYAYNRETKCISLDQMIYDILSVDVPLQVLCSDGCRGLCPQCGQNLNEGRCECVHEEDHETSPNNPFAKLKDLF